MIVDRVYFFPTVACTGTDGPTDKVYTGEIQLQDREVHFGAANTDNNCRVIRMTDNSKLYCARFKSKASAVNKALGHRILGHIVSFLSILLSLYLPQPPTTYFSLFLFLSSSSPGIANTSAGGGGRRTDKSPGVLDSAVLVRAQHIAARRAGCHILSDGRATVFILIPIITSF